MSHRPTALYFLRGADVRRQIEEANLTLTEAAARLGISRSYFSQILAEQRPLSPKVRRKLLTTSPFQEQGAALLWIRREKSP